MDELGRVVKLIEEGLPDEPGPFSVAGAIPAPYVPTESEFEGLRAALTGDRTLTVSAPSRIAAERALRAAQHQIASEAHLRNAQRLSGP